MNISFNGFGENILTFEADSTLKNAGVPVKFTQSGKVAPCAAGDKICGYAVSVREGYAAVQLKGFVKIPRKGDIALGWQTVVAASDGKVTVGSDGTQVLVVSVDTNTAGIIL